jgi:hypothetical protein
MLQSALLSSARMEWDRSWKSPSSHRLISDYTRGLVLTRQIGLGSPAATHVADIARKVGEAFVDQAYLKLRAINAYEVGPVLVSPGNKRLFKHSIHSAYDTDDFNSFELDFADALDRAKLVWCRNPARSGYSIPLPSPGKTLNFYPDFLVWKEENVFAIDTKGEHLHADAARKLVSIKPASNASTRVFVSSFLTAWWTPLVRSPMVRATSHGLLSPVGSRNSLIAEHFQHQSNVA